MGVALIVGLAGGVMGWMRARRRGGSRFDCLQYAVAHGIPAFLVTLVVLAVAGNLGWLA